MFAVRLIISLFCVSSASAQMVEVAGGPAQLQPLDSLSDIQGSWKKVGYACVSADLSKIQKRWSLENQRRPGHVIEFKDDQFFDHDQSQSSGCQVYDGRGTVQATKQNRSIELVFRLTARSSRTIKTCGLDWSYGQNDKQRVDAYLFSGRHLAFAEPSGPPYCSDYGAGLVPVTLWDSQSPVAF